MKAALFDANGDPIEIEVCEHGHEDTTTSPCPICQPVRKDTARRGAELCRTALAESGGSQ